MTRKEVLTQTKHQADEWYESYELTHRTQQAIDRIKDFTEKFGTVVMK